MAGRVCCCCFRRWRRRSSGLWARKNLGSYVEAVPGGNSDAIALPETYEAMNNACCLGKGLGIL
jgi:hypothetical protein